MLVVLYYVILAFQAAVIGFLLVYNILSFVLFAIAAYKINSYMKQGKLANLDILYRHPGLPAVSFLLPAYNEENGIIESIESLMNLHYPKFEIIIINDGSTDGTLRRVKNQFNFKAIEPRNDQRLETAPNAALGTAKIEGIYEMPAHHLSQHTNIARVLLVNKQNGGKADALNAGINLARHPYVCSMDADSLMDRNALLIGMRPFLDYPDTVVAVGGQVGIANGATVKQGRVLSVGLPKKIVEIFQVIEYAKSFNVGRTALASLNSLIVLSGVFSIFQRDLILKIGGYLTKHMKTPVGLRYCGARDTVCEDMEIVVRLYRYLQEQNIKGKVEYLPFPISWTEVPSRFSDLARQRNRWYRGLSESLWFHKRMLLNPFFRQVGLFAMPYQFFFEFIGPLVEFIGYLSLPLFLGLGYLNMLYLTLFMLLAIVYGTLLSELTVLLGIWIGSRYKTEYQNYNIFYSTGLKDILLLILFSLFINIGYRQYLLWAQVRGFVDFVRGKKSWEKFKHQGFGTAP